MGGPYLTGKPAQSLRRIRRLLLRITLRYLSGSCALTVSGVLLPLHGAAAAEHVGDPERDLIGAGRALVGSGALSERRNSPLGWPRNTGGAPPSWSGKYALPSRRRPGFRRRPPTAAAAAAAAAPATARPPSRRCSAPSCPAPPWRRWWNPAAAKFIVAKNPMNYHLAYSPLAAATYILDIPGPTPATVRGAPFRNLQRPWFPVDPDIPNLRPTLLT